MSGAGSEEQEVMAAMGFSAFGKPRRRGGRVTSSATSSLPQLVSGTELAGRAAEYPIGSVLAGAHGVLYLLNGTSDFDGLVALEGSDNDKEEGEKSGEESYSGLLADIEREKRKFDALETAQFVQARAATNVFEALGRHRFLNRSAMKLVTLDHIFQWTQNLRQRKDVFTFADICGGPGGFSEYLLWRAGQICRNTEGDKGSTQRVQGFGITLKGADNNCDWRVQPQPHGLFEVCYGEDGTGNIYSLRNIHSFRNVVRNRCPRGVDLAVADGGFLDARSKPNQEAMMTRLILAEVLAMFAVLRVGGDFVCKTFELRTPAMLQLCWILHCCFEQFAVVKPIVRGINNTSRPASSERYIIARGLRQGHPLPELLERLEDQLDKSCSADFQLRFLLNDATMSEDVAFVQYMAMANETIARCQLEACCRINEFAANTNKRKSREGSDLVKPQEYYQCWHLGDWTRRKVTQSEEKSTKHVITCFHSR